MLETPKALSTYRLAFCLIIAKALCDRIGLLFQKSNNLKDRDLSKMGNQQETAGLITILVVSGFAGSLLYVGLGWDPQRLHAEN